MTIMRQRVAITAVGCVSPLGHTWDLTWRGICQAKVPIQKISAFDAGDTPASHAYQVSNYDTICEDLEQRGELAKQLVRAHVFAKGAAYDAYRQAGLKPGDYQRNDIAVCLGVGMTSPDFKWMTKHFIPKDFDHEDMRYHNRIIPTEVTKGVAKIFSATGGTTTVHTACASSGQSVGEAFEMIANGERQMVITGGADSMINPFYAAGFLLLGALAKNSKDPKTASRPFDLDRAGFVLGEGACILVLENMETALQRGANIVAEICGYGVTESAYRITDLHPEGQGPIQSMQGALADANMSPDEIGYINAHGTSTPINDRVEALSINRVFSTNPNTAPFVSSTKSMTGHLISAAGAIELAICAEALRQQTLPPTVNLFTKDPLCDLRFTPNEATPFKFKAALSNSVGFGGSNTSLIVKQWEGP